MPGFLLRPRALADLDSIWTYTVDTWGEDQAERYIHLLNDAFVALAAKPDLGHSCERIREGYRKYKSGRHIIFYRVVDGSIDIVRVLHQSMDIERHL